MKRNLQLLLLIATVYAGLLLLFLPFYSFLKHWKAFALHQFLLALFFTGLTKEQEKKILAIVPGGLLIAVFIRVMIEGIADPTSHNLWPFELIMYAVVAFPSALIGTGVGFFAKRIRAMSNAGHKNAK